MLLLKLLLLLLLLLKQVLNLKKSEKKYLAGVSGLKISFRAN